jgi:hypothetical protein
LRIDALDALAKLLAGCACMGFGWEAQQTGKSTGGQGKAAGLYRGGFSAVRVCASACFEQGRPPWKFGLSFLNLSYKAPKMALYNAAETQKAADLFIMMHSIVTLR